MGRGGVSPTLNAFDNGNDTRATVIIFENSYRDGARVGKSVCHTLPAKMGTGGLNTPMIAVPIQGTIIGRADTAGPQGPGFGQPGDPMFTLDTASQHGVATTIARRLTPIECERLMGWPDNHTLHRADGKTNSDSARYKMCGNGVASPVSQWIGEQLLPLLNDD